jgi:hypothetical protein
VASLLSIAAWRSAKDRGFVTAALVLSALEVAALAWLLATSLS